MDQDLYECSVCLSPFTKPKLIDCHHTFCLNCLENLVDHNSTRIFIKCPLCNKRSKIPEGGVVNFTTNFYIEKPANQRSDQVPCKNHPQIRADSYCKDCKIALCSKCILRNHKDHTYLDLECEESTNQIVEEYSRRKENMEAKVEELQIFQTILEDKSCELDDFAAHTINDVQRHVENVCAIIKNMGANVVQNIEDNLDNNKHKLKMLRKEVEMINTNMSQKVRDMDKSLKQKKTMKIVETMSDLDDSWDESSSTESSHFKISLPDISCLSFVENKTILDMDTIGMLVPVQSPLMVTGFEELFTDHKAEQDHSTLASQTDCLLYSDEPSNDCQNLQEPIMPNNPLTDSSKYQSSNSSEIVPSLDQPMKIERDINEPVLEAKPSDPVRRTVSVNPSNTAVSQSTLLQTDKPVPGYAEIIVPVKDLDFYDSHECPVINGITWGITVKRLGNKLCLYLDQPIEGNSNIQYCEVDCQLSIENKTSDLTIRRQVENRMFEPGGDDNVNLEVNWQTISNAVKNYLVNDLLTVGIFMKYKTIKYHKGHAQH